MTDRPVNRVESCEEEEEEEEEVGVFRAASKDVLEKRVIRKAKRRIPVVTDDKPNSTTGVSTSTFAFGGFAAVSAAMPTVTSTASLSMGGTPKPAGAAADAESHYLQHLRCLNESVLRWIDDHLTRDPICILTPICADYDLHLKNLEDEFPQATHSVFGGTPVVTTAAAAAAVGFTFPSSSTGASSAVSSPFVVSDSQTSMSPTAVAGLHGLFATTMKDERKPLAPPMSGQRLVCINQGENKTPIYPESSDENSSLSGFDFGRHNLSAKGIDDQSTAAFKPSDPMNIKLNGQYDLIVQHIWEPWPRTGRICGREYKEMLHNKK